jgi:hypothetical protein
MRNREMERVLAQNPDLDERLTKWRSEHRDGTLEDAVRDLEIWPKNPGDKDAQAIVWIALRNR